MNSVGFVAYSAHYSAIPPAKLRQTAQNVFVREDIYNAKLFPYQGCQIPSLTISTLREQDISIRNSENSIHILENTSLIVFNEVIPTK